jgi:hypothetical protein
MVVMDWPLLISHTIWLEQYYVCQNPTSSLNAVPVLNPDALAEARASDERRKCGETRGPLDGIPYTAKNSYKVKGLTVAAGSPAFADLIATDDAFAIAQLRKAGADPSVANQYAADGQRWHATWSLWTRRFTL